MENFDETSTTISDDYEERAEAVYVTTKHPYSSCYDKMLEQTELLVCARVRQEEARKIRKNFKEIAKEFNGPDSGMLRKGVLTESRGKAFFLADQLVLVCEHMFDKLLFVVFKGSAEAHPYVVIVFSSNCHYGDVCKVEIRVEIFKKEAAVNNFLFWFKV